MGSAYRPIGIVQMVRECVAMLLNIYVGLMRFPNQREREGDDKDEDQKWCFYLCV